MREASLPVPDGARGRKPLRGLVADVLLPFAISRAVLVAVAAYATQLAPSWTYFQPIAATRGWAYVPSLPLDVWARYDTAWYLDLAANGYAPAPGQSNLAFFPLYPLLARGLHAILPAAWHGLPALYLSLLAVANAAAIAGLALVHAWVRAEWGDDALARRTVLLLLAFPAGFFLSCAYSESLFLALSAASLLALARGRPWAAGAAGLLAALTRPTGVLLAVPILWRAARVERVERRTAAAAAALPAAGLLLHAGNLWRLTGDPLAFLHVQSAWGRGIAWPWTFLLDRPGLHPWTAPLDRGAILLFAALAVALLVREKRPALAAYALLSVAPLVLSGTPMSATRLLAAVFPAFVPLARLAPDRGGTAVACAFAALQAVTFAAWSRFHWVA